MNLGKVSGNRRAWILGAVLASALVLLGASILPRVAEADAPLTRRAVLPLVANDEQRILPSPPTNTSSATPSPTLTSTRAATATPTSIVPPRTLSEGAVQAVVASIPGPGGLPNKVTVKLDSPPLRAYITEDIPAELDSAFIGIDTLTVARYGQTVLQTVRQQFPALGSSGEIELDIWSVRDWHIYPSFLFGTDWDCTLNDDFTWFCPYPTFEVDLDLSSGRVRYASVAWVRHPFFRPLP